MAFFDPWETEYWQSRIDKLANREVTVSRVVNDSYRDDTYRETPYTEWLTAHTPVWAWGAFTYPDMSVFAPLGTLGERRDFVANQVHAQIERESANG